jgi:hypothetical protein
VLKTAIPLHIQPKKRIATSASAKGAITDPNCVTRASLRRMTSLSKNEECDKMSTAVMYGE